MTLFVADPDQTPTIAMFIKFVASGDFFLIFTTVR